MMVILAIRLLLHSRPPPCSFHPIQTGDRSDELLSRNFTNLIQPANRLIVSNSLAKLVCLGQPLEPSPDIS